MNRYGRMSKNRVMLVTLATCKIRCNRRPSDVTPALSELTFLLTQMSTGLEHDGKGRKANSSAYLDTKLLAAHRRVRWPRRAGRGLRDHWHSRSGRDRADYQLTPRAARPCARPAPMRRWPPLSLHSRRHQSCCWPMPPHPGPSPIA